MIANIESLFKKTAEANKAIGAVLGVIEQENIHYFCYGKKSVQDDDPVSIDTLFEIGSITKVFTTFLLAEMTQKGEVELNNEVELFLPSVKIPEFNSNKIKLWHLATHRSGLPNIQTNLNPRSLLNPYADYSFKDLYQFLNHFSLRNPPGEHFEYSNIGMSLLGHILCIRAQKSFEELLSKAILKPLSMFHTGIKLTPTLQGYISMGHHLGRIVPHWEISEVMLGAGGIISNIQDMTQFLAANLDLINAPISDLLKECHEIQYTPTPNESIGLGWIISHSNGSNIIWHDGITGGFRSFLGFNPKMRRGIVILSNATVDWINELSFSLLKNQ